MKHQPFPDRRSRDLFPKPYSNHYSERFPWVEPDDPKTTRKLLFAAGLAFFVTLSLIIVIAELGKAYGF